MNIQNQINLYVNANGQLVPGSESSSVLYRNNLNRNVFFIVTPLSQAAVVKLYFQYTNLTAEGYTQVAALAPGKGGDITPETASYYELVKDWAVFKCVPNSNILTKFPSTVSGTIGVAVSIKEPDLSTSSEYTRVADISFNDTQLIESLEVNQYVTSITGEIETDYGTMLIGDKLVKLATGYTIIRALWASSMTAPIVFTGNPSLIDTDFEDVDVGSSSLLDSIIAAQGLLAADMQLLQGVVVSNNNKVVKQYKSKTLADQDINNIEEGTYCMVNSLDNNQYRFYLKQEGVLVPVGSMNGGSIIVAVSGDDFDAVVKDFASKIVVPAASYLGVDSNGTIFFGKVTYFVSNPVFSINTVEVLVNGRLLVVNRVAEEWDIVFQSLQMSYDATPEIVDKPVFRNGLFLQGTGTDDQAASITHVSAIINSQKGIVDGIATLDGAGKVPSSQLPSYVDDVEEYASRSAFPQTGVSGKIYVAIDTQKTYRWSGSEYIELNPQDLSNYYNKSEVNSLLLDKQNALDMTSYVVTLQQVTAEVANLYQEGRIDSSYLINGTTTDYGNVLFAVEENDNEVYEFTVIASGTMYRVTYDFNTFEYNIYPLTIGGETNVVVDITNTPYTYSTLTGFQDNDILTIDTRGKASNNLLSLPNIAPTIISGVECSIQDGVITLNGTATGTMFFNFDLGVEIQPQDLSMYGYLLSGSLQTIGAGDTFFLVKDDGTTVASPLVSLHDNFEAIRESTGTTTETIRKARVRANSGSVFNNTEFVVSAVNGLLTTKPEYEPYGESTNVEVYDRLPSSVLGQQDIGKDLSTNVQNYTVCLNDSSFSVGFTSTNRKLVNIVKDRRYFAISNAVTQEHSTTHYSLFYSLSYAGLSTFKSRLTIDGYWCSIMQANETTSEAVPGITAGFGNVLNGQVNFMVLIDLTEYGLENLTAQQVYDLLKDNLDLIASGANVSELVGTVKGTNQTQITFTGHIGHQLEFRSINGVNVDFTQTKLTYHEYVSTELIGLLTEQLENLNVRVSELEKENTDIKLELVEIRSILTNKADIGVNTIFKLASVNNELLLVENDIQVNENILIVPETNNFDFVRNLLVPLSFNAGQVVDLNIYVNTLSSNSRLNYNVTATIIKRVGGVDTVMGEATIVVYTQNNTYRSFIASILVDNATTLNVGEQLVVRLRSSDDTLVLLTGNEDEKSYLKYTQ